MHTQAEIYFSAILSSPRAHVLHGCVNIFLRFGPHQENVAMLCTYILGAGRDASEIQKRTSVLLVRLYRIRGHFKLINIALKVNFILGPGLLRSEEHTSELQSLMRTSYD